MCSQLPGKEIPFTVFLVDEDDSFEGFDKLPGDFASGDHRGARRKVLQNYAGPF